MTDDPVQETLAGGCLCLTLNRPERMNAWDTAKRARIVERLSAAATRPEVTSVVISGAGDRACCAGRISTS